MSRVREPIVLAGLLTVTAVRPSIRLRSHRVHTDEAPAQVVTRFRDRLDREGEVIT